MINYFYEHQSIPDVSSICRQLYKLKQRIIAGDYVDPQKEFNECKDLFETIKEYAIEVGDERLANAQTIYKIYFLLFCNLSLYFSLIKGGEYKKSWSVLQDCMDDIKFIGRHVEINARKELPDIYDLLEDYEGLYPYKVFASGEYIIGKSHCSICGKSMQSLACPHIKGNLYYGDIAVEMIDEIREVQAVSLVSHPKDKRCIIELQEDDRSESDKFAKLEQYIALGQPFLQRFSIKSVIETRQREDIIKVDRNQLCSCGSGIKFKKCCGKNLYYKHERNIITPKEIVRFE